MCMFTNKNLRLRSMYAIFLQIYLLLWQGSSDGKRVGCENDKVIDVALVGAPTDSEDATLTMKLVMDYLNTIVLTGGWKMEVSLVIALICSQDVNAMQRQAQEGIAECNHVDLFSMLPTKNNSHLLQDVTGSGLYQIANSMDDECLEAIVGPGSSTSAKLMHPYAVKSGVPHVLPFATDPALGQTKRFPLMVRLSPPDTYQTKAVLDILQFYGWERLSIITTDNDYGFGVEDSLIELAATRRVKLEVVKRLKTDKVAYVEEISEILRQLLEANSHPIAVATNLDAASHLLQEAFTNGMIVSRNWVWILLDGVIDPGILQVQYKAESGKQQVTNFNGLIGTRPATSGGNLLGDLKHFWEELNPGIDWRFNNGFGLGLEKFIDGLNPETADIKNIDGFGLHSAILRVNETGLTTPLIFDQNGKINSTKYDIMLSSNGKWKVMGEWRSITKLNVSSVLFLNFSKSLRIAGKSPRKLVRQRKKLRTSNSQESRNADKPIIHVVTILESPFVMQGRGNGSYQSENLTNRVYKDSVPPSEWQPGMNIELHGYCIDMLQKISQNAGIRYTLRLVNDSSYGGYVEDLNDWNGLIGDLRRGDAHAAVAPITVTAERTGVVEFSTGFMDVGLKFIINSSTVAALSHRRDDSPNAFGFLLPFEASLYYAIGVCVLCLASFLNLLSRVSPYGARGHFYLGPRSERFRKKISNCNLKRKDSSKWNATTHSGRNVKKLHAERDEADTRMGINNALYFVWASLFWQTPETVPRAPSARLLTAVWYLSAVVFVASYTAKLVAFVTSNNIEVGIWNSISDLISQTKIEYGTVSDSSVEFIFHSSAIKMANSIYNYLKSDPDKLLVPTSAIGIERVKNGKYAFIWDSLVLDYEAYLSECRLRTINVGFGGVTYAIAFPKNSPLKTIFSRNILRLKESGYLSTIWQRYFSELDKCNRVSSNQDMSFSRLKFEDLAGIFYLVAFAMTLGFFLLSLEWVWAAIQDVDKNTVTAPKSISAALKLRTTRLKRDIIQNWFPRRNPSQVSYARIYKENKTVCSQSSSSSQNLQIIHKSLPLASNDSSVILIENQSEQHNTPKTSSIRFVMPGRSTSDTHQST